MHILYLVRTMSALFFLEKKIMICHQYYEYVMGKNLQIKINKNKIALCTGT